MDFAALPPEVNSGRIYAGPGAGPMLAAAAAWDALGADLQSVATSYQSVISGLTDGPWQGPASVSMAAAAAPYVTWMNATATQAGQAANQARAAASAYEAAFAMTVPPTLIAANRAQLAALVATNFLGLNTPAIMATEAHYAEMWAQDAAAMYGYAGSSAAASTLSPFAPAPDTTNPAGLTGQSAAVAQASGTAAGTHAQNLASSLSAVPQMLQGLAGPMQSASPSGLSSMVMGTGTSAATSAVSTPASMLTGLTGATGNGAVKSAGNTTNAAGALGNLVNSLNSGPVNAMMDTIGFGEDGIGLVGFDGAGLGTDFLGVGMDFLGADSLFESEGLMPFDGLGALGLVPALEGPAHLGAGLGAAGASASLGQAASLGGALSVPQAWAAAVEAAPITPAGAMALPAANLSSAAPAIATAGPSMPKLPLVSTAGREADGLLQRIGLRPTVVPHSPMAG